ncbi:MAG: acetyl-CoA carboxylase biotin carboxyl carrier protein [bacterium]
MRTSYIRSLIKLVEESEIESLEVSSWGRRVRIVQRSAESESGRACSPMVVQPATAPAPTAPPAPAMPSAPVATTPVVDDTDRLVPIKSPMVGTFYSAPSPDADPYVSPNQKINVGQVVCIVEAMKLMNEIEAEVGGRIAKILVENAQPVEFGQVMFLIEPD